MQNFDQYLRPKAVRKSNEMQARVSDHVVNDDNKQIMPKLFEKTRIELVRWALMD